MSSHGLSQELNHLLLLIPGLGRDSIYEILSKIPGGLCLDIGAGMGVLTQKIKKLNSAHRVIAFEPFPNNVEFFKQRLKGVEGVTIIPKAVSNHAGKGSFFVSSTVKGTEKGWERYKGYSSHGKLVEETALVDTSQTYKVDLCTLDETIQEHVLFMKMDVQGAEKQVLEGASGLFEDYGVDILYVEFSGDIHILQMLNSLGYLIFDTDYLLLSNGSKGVEAVFETMQVVNLSSGQQALTGRMKDLSSSFEDYCTSFEHINSNFGILQTDLVCVHHRFLPQFIEQLSHLAIDHIPAVKDTSKASFLQSFLAMLRPPQDAPVG